MNIQLNFIVKFLLTSSITMSSLGLVACNSDDKNTTPPTEITPPEKIENIKALRLIGDYKIPTKTMFNGVEFGGISGLDIDPNGGYWAISDDRGGERGAPRFYHLSIDLNQDRLNSVSINKMIYIRDTKNQLLPTDRRTMDPESIRLNSNGHLYISSEGNFNEDKSVLVQPYLREYNQKGEFIREFTLAEGFEYTDNKTSGARSNKVFEALTISSNQDVFMANEDTLIQDGPITSMQNGSVVRLTQYDPKTAKATAQYAYALPPIPVNSQPNTYPPDNGLSEILAISNVQFIAVERAFAGGIGNTIRLVKTEIKHDTTNILEVPSLKDAKFKAMEKSLLLEMPIHYQGIKLDNIEAISWGPVLANGNRTLILVADNNFSDEQSTHFIAFEVLK